MSFVQRVIAAIRRRARSPAGQRVSDCARGRCLLRLMAVILALPLTASVVAQETDAETPPAPPPTVKMGSAGSSGGAISGMSETTGSDVAADASEADVAAEEIAPEAPLSPRPTADAPRTTPAGSLPEFIELDDPETQIAPFHIAEVLVEGTVYDDRADLTIQIDVEISRDQGWYDVPLRLSQARIYSKTASGPGRQSPGVPAMREDGLHWQFRGRGTHRLVFAAGVPVRTTPAGRQLQLSLPQMPPLFEARANLRFEKDNLVIRSYNREATIRTRSGETPEGGTLLEASLPNGRLDLLWQERGQAPEPDWQASSNLTLRRTLAAWELLVQQTVQRTESGRGTLSIRPPSGFTVWELVGQPLQSWSLDPAQPGWVTLNLGDDAGERLELRWVLRAPFPTSGGIIDLDGFEISGVRVHSGRIRISPVAGFQLIPIADALRFLERVEDEASPADTTPAVFAYSFSAPSWRLSLNAKEIEALFACEPRYDLLLAEDKAELNGAFSIRQEAGDLRTFRVDVSAMEAAGWLVNPRREGTGAASQITRNGPLVQFDWPASAGDSKSAVIRFEKPLDGDAAAFDVPLPRASATSLEPPELVVRAADALRVEIDADGRPSSAALPAAPPIQARVVSRLQLAPSAARIGVTATIEPRTVKASTIISIEDVQNRGVTVEQAIRFQVHYGRLDAFRIRLPEQLPVPSGAEKFALRIRVDGRDIDHAEWANGVLRVPLPEPLIGRFSAVLSYVLPRLEGAQTVTAPVIEVAECGYTDVLLEAPPSLGISVASESSGWRLVPTSAERLRWVAGGDARDANLTIARTVRQSLQRLVISGGWVWTRIESGGAQSTTARYRVEPGATSLTFRLPVQAQTPDVRVAGRAVPDLQPSGEESRNQWTVRLPRSSSTDPVEVMIAYRVEAAGKLQSMARVGVDLPEFAGNVFVERAVWVCELPDTDLLLASPAGMTRLFDWRREGAFWTRRPSVRFRDEMVRAGFGEELADGAKMAGVRYVYSQTGPRSRLELWSIDRSLVVLFGAGVTLIVGFVFWSFPALRNVATLLVLGFLVCLAGLWIAEPIQVFLQPAAFGAVMATIATAIDSRARRRRLVMGAQESSFRLVPRPQVFPVGEPIRSTVLRPTGSDHGVPG
ncbi:MAG: hypothetical protein KF774_12720 [Planctomyces sp.]|nr:hypothetical protein [Planctomyces sp.]